MSSGSTTLPPGFVVDHTCIFPGRKWAGRAHNFPVQSYASLENLEELREKIEHEQTNFNSLVLTFVQPSLTKYTSNDLTCTRLFGYTCTSDGTTKTVSRETRDPKVDFQNLKRVIADPQAHGVETYIEVGG
ncbi:hypothetical protein [Bradyrhizobium sp. CCGB20]|uniref:hypothetical protein n=1 Tax=Bradyrhizobium sp. CCGB20 TaxID=2949633 RepID=UPI0020B2FBB8|nr:hypothetical protein [Bradyrhizobium sp. CCGB20]MCP3396916.1 hypothetical protein [Bradyrhizobium sp. CCGB20]